MNHRSMTWNIFTEWLGGGDVVIVTDCVFFYASEWQTDSWQKRFGCVLGPKSTCLQRLHFSNTTSCRRVSLRVGWQSECVADARRKSSHSAWMLALTKRRRTLPLPYYMAFDTKGWSSTWLNCCFYEENDVEHVGPMPQPPKQTQQTNDKHATGPPRTGLHDRSGTSHKWTICTAVTKPTATELQSPLGHKLNVQSQKLSSDLFEPSVSGPLTLRRKATFWKPNRCRKWGTCSRFVRVAVRAGSGVDRQRVWQEPESDWSRSDRYAGALAAWGREVVIYGRRTSFLTGQN